MVKVSCFVGVATATALALAVGCSAGTSDDQDQSQSGFTSTAGVTVNTGLVVSQVYTGGAATGTPYDHAFVEIFNRSEYTLSLDGVSLQYAAKNTLFDPTVLLKLPSKELAPGQYFLVELGSAPPPAPVAVDGGDGGSDGPSGPSPTLTGADVKFDDVQLSPASGMIALVRAPLSCGSGDVPCNAADAVNLIKYGTNAPTSLTPTTAALRQADGCTDTGNPRDFTVGAPTPRNSGTVKPCPLVPLTPVDGGAQMVLLNEVEVTQQGGITGSQYAYAEILCTPGASLQTYYFVATDPKGLGVVIVDLSAKTCANANANHPDVGIVYIKAPGTEGHLAGESQTTVLPLLPDTDPDAGVKVTAVPNGALMIVQSPVALLDGTDFETKKDGTISLPQGASVVDGITLAPAGGTLPKYVPRPDQPSGGAVAATRFRDNKKPLEPTAWFTGALKGGPDSVDYDPAQASKNMPAGATLTPGKLNFQALTPADGGKDAAPADDDAGSETHVSSTSDTTAGPKPPGAPPPTSAASICSMQAGRSPRAGFAAFAALAMAVAFGARRRRR